MKNNFGVIETRSSTQEPLKFKMSAKDEPETDLELLFRWIITLQNAISNSTQKCKLKDI